MTPMVASSAGSTRPSIQHQLSCALTGPTLPRLASAIRRDAFSSVSAHSPVGVGAPGDPPAGAEVQLAVLQPERADGHVELAPPGVGVDPARRPRSRRRGARARGRRCTSRAAILGAPVTEPGGKVAAMASAQPAPGRSRPSTVDTRCASPGCSSTAHRDGTVTEPHSHTRPRSLRTRSTIITFSARSLARNPSGVAAVPLMGDERTRSPSPGQEQLGRGRGHVHAVVRAAAPRRCRAPGSRRRARRPGRPRRRPAGERGGEPTGEVDLVDVAGGDGLPDGGDPGPEGRRRRGEVVHADGPAGDPGHGGPGQGRAGRRRANRAHTGAPAKPAAPPPRSRSRRGRRGRR